MAAITEVIITSIKLILSSYEAIEKEFEINKINTNKIHGISDL